MGEEFAYSAFGLTIRSEIELPELFPNPSAVAADVTIAFGAVPAPDEADAKFAVDGQGVFLCVEGVARYWISRGSRILIEPEPGMPLRNVRLYLLGSAMGVLLHQRGLLPLHANAIEINGRAFAFMGRSGAGKSTLAAAFHDRGFRVIADDVCVIRFDDAGQAFAFPGVPRLRLWEEALTATGRKADAYELSYAGDESFRKFDVPMRPAISDTTEVPLAAVYQLIQGDRLHVRSLEGAEAADSIFANTYRGAYVRSVGDPRAHWLASLKLISTTSIFELARPWDLARIVDDVPGITAHAMTV